MDEFYVLYSFTTDGSGASYDLSFLFLTPGVANTTYQNISWQMAETTNGDTAWSGAVDADGTLEQGDAPSGFIFTDSQPYCATTWQVQVQFNPDPCQPCRCCESNDSDDSSCSDDPSGQKCCPASDTSDDSVELATGRFVFQKQLLSLTGLGSGSWQFALNYKANFDIDGILGKNFGYPQYMHLEALGYMGPGDYGEGTGFYGPNIQLVTNQLSRAIFGANSYYYDDEVTYVSPVGNNTGATLSLNQATGLFTLVTSDGTTTTFFAFSNDYYAFPWPAPGQIQSIVDRYGNSQTFEWTSANDIPQLLSVTDSYGRSTNYSYYGEEGGYRLRQLTDFLGRQLNFQYDAYDHLVDVVTPSILKAAPGNTFPGGTAYVFQYDVGNADPARRDDLIKIWYPNQTGSYLNVESRTVDVEAVYASATPRYQITYGQNINDTDTYGKVLTETLGDPENEIGGTATFDYTTCSDDLPTNIIDSSEAGTIVNRTIYTDRNGNRTIYDFNAYWTTSRLEVDLNRNKNSLELDNEDEGGVATPPFVTWTKFNAQNQPLVIVYPEGNSTEYIYEDGNVTGLDVPLPYVARRGLLLSESRLPGNSIGIPSRAGSNGTYFTPQNGGTTPTNADCSRYATLFTFDYQKDTLATVSGDTALQALLGLDAGDIETLIAYVNSQMTATDGTGGIPAGFSLNLGDINGDGTGNGASSGLPDATHLGNVIQITRPAVLLVGGTTQARIELFTLNLRGQITTATDSEGNLTVTTRYPENDPEGTGQNISPTLSTQQYGLVREIHRDANPYDVMSLVGASGDLVSFVPGLITRTNTPGIYQDLVTRYEGSSGCSTCAYDPMGNVLSETDPRGFTTIYDRNEVGKIYRVTAPAPYNFRVETSYDANRNVTQVDTEDFQVQYNSPDPTAVGYGTFTPSGSGTTAHVPMIPGMGGALRPGWFSNLMSYDILDNKIQEDIDATGSTPSSLVTQYQYDANQNLTMIVKPEGNTVEYDYDERDLKIAERVGGPSGAVTAYSYDGNKNLINVISPCDRSGGAASDTLQTVYITDGFGQGTMVTLTGSWTLQNTYDGFDRIVTATDAVGGVVNSIYDPTSALIQKQTEGAIGGATPTDRSGSENVPLANSIMRFDEARRLYEQQQDVFIATGSSLPSGRSVTHTGGGLALNSTANDHTGTVTLTSGGNSYVLTRNVYDRVGRVVSILADNTAETDYSYDGAGRRILATDSLGNTEVTQFDGNGNPVQVTRTEVCTITEPTVTNEVFVDFTWFDCLNRPVVTGTQGADGCLTANLGLCCPWQGLPSTLFSLIGYDSRGNKVTVTDPKVNVVVSVYDGASRLIEIQQEMRQNGDGRSGPVANQTFLTAGGGIIRTEYVLDGNGRLVELADDRGGSTVYTYDLLDRLITKELADGSNSTRVYDLASDLTGYTDENGSVFANAFDALGRKISIAITQATNVGGTTAQSFQYDGLSRQTQAIDTVSINAEVDFFYDSLNRVLEEEQLYASVTCYTTHTAWQSLVATQVTYPSTDITISNGYDPLYRRNAISGISAINGTLDTVEWEFFGPSRIVETNYGGGSLIASQMNNARTNSAVQTSVPLPPWGDDSSDQLGYDGVGRMITKRYLTGGINGTTYAYSSTTALVGFTTSFGRNGNKLYERHLHAESRSHLYQPFNSDGSFAVGYDSANRLNQYQRGVLSTATIPFRVNAGASISTPTTLPGADQVRTYGLDGLGNWKTSNFTLVESGGGTSTTAEVRQHNYVNEITSVTDTTGGTPTTAAFAYDYGNNTNQLQGNGNLVNDGVRTYQWDALNRLIQVGNASTSAVIATYVYDALGRRIQKTINDLGGGFGGLTGDIPAATTSYYYDNQQIAEERDSGTPDAWEQIYFWGQYIDELLFFAIPTATVYRVLSDLLYRSVASVDTSNNIVEAYDTDAYGNTLCYSGTGTDEQWFTDDDVQTNNPINSTIFTGRQFDPESQIYYYRARYYSSNIARFLSRDPIDTSDRNLYRYVQSNPIIFVDPTGTQNKEIRTNVYSMEFDLTRHITSEDNWVTIKYSCIPPDGSGASSVNIYLRSVKWDKGDGSSFSFGWIVRVKEFTKRDYSIVNTSGGSCPAGQKGAYIDMYIRLRVTVGADTGPELPIDWDEIFGSGIKDRKVVADILVLLECNTCCPSSGNT